MKIMKKSKKKKKLTKFKEFIGLILIFTVVQFFIIRFFVVMLESSAYKFNPETDTVKISGVIEDIYYSSGGARRGSPYCDICINSIVCRLPNDYRYNQYSPLEFANTVHVGDEITILYRTIPNFFVGESKVVVEAYDENEEYRTLEGYLKLREHGLMYCIIILVIFELLFMPFLLYFIFWICVELIEWNRKRRKKIERYRRKLERQRANNNTGDGNTGDG